jgi:hypothetical protein
MLPCIDGWKSEIRLIARMPLSDKQVGENIRLVWAEDA